jgi:CheY-like chemotaxis protein
MSSASFPYRILLVEDEPALREVGVHLLTSQGYEVLAAEDGFDALLALKRSLPDVIISDLCMPKMNGFEFLSLVRRRFPSIPVIVLSGEFSRATVPETVLADAFFSKGEYKREELFEKITSLLQEIPLRPRLGTSDKAAIWVKNAEGKLAVTCTSCLRSFPIDAATDCLNEVECDFCATMIRFEIISEYETDRRVLG